MALGVRSNSLSSSSVRWTPAAPRVSRAGRPCMAGEGTDAAASPDEAIRLRKSERYVELFSRMELPADLRKLGVQQIADGEKPWFEKHNEKVAMYDKLFASGTASGIELVKGAEKIRTGKLRKLSDIEGPDSAVRMGVKFDNLFDD
eukprot:CAMPEP_0173392232 /NCGR_PEP_ID=MMETSP1356-20130122/18831_1 /TAXON_ID=77927 ORGANISM="Hemiselmis virescens, Strain PCC157" /NCGR_SAMPLE_ID=MMETSP1356 /ASSEMBLY_ACC=CAM_ASM_000847 /LENGTH=145 /DNA_ID=CAMNT_0014349977 /DNA_START=163 /DNA_END=600 /DNA_ORIENTATION=+